jgi:excisionase family DNA binding protein
MPAKARMTIDSPVMTLKECARYLKVAPVTVYRLIARGLPSFRIGSDHRFNKEHIDAWMSQREAEEGGRVK